MWLVWQTSLCIVPVDLMIMKVFVLCVINNIISEIWILRHCLGLRHETIVCALVCLATFLLNLLEMIIRHMLYKLCLDSTHQVSDSQLKKVLWSFCFLFCYPFPVCSYYQLVKYTKLLSNQLKRIAVELHGTKYVSVNEKSDSEFLCANIV